MIIDLELKHPFVGRFTHGKLLQPQGTVALFDNGIVPTLIEYARYEMSIKAGFILTQYQYEEELVRIKAQEISK